MAEETRTEETAEVTTEPEQAGVVILDVVFGGILRTLQEADAGREAIVRGEPFASILLGKTDKQ